MSRPNRDSMAGHDHEDGLTSLSIFITPQCYKITTIPPSEREGGEGALHPTKEGTTCCYQVKTPALSSRADQVITSFPFPPYSMCALFDAVADIVNQQLAAFLPAHLLGSFACACPSLIALFLLSLFPFLTCLRFPAKPSQICYQIRGKETPPLSQSFTSCGYPCFVCFFSPDP